MSHEIIIIGRPTGGGLHATHDAPEVSYEYKMTVPHDKTPQQVGEMVAKVLRRLDRLDDE